MIAIAIKYQHISAIMHRYAVENMRSGHFRAASYWQAEAAHAAYLAMQALHLHTVARDLQS